MVVTALDGLPEELGRLMRNVAVTVEHGPGPPGLLGLYQGIPLTSRTSQYAGVLPDRITIYRQATCVVCRTEQEVAEQVRRTVIHEIAHHFGIDDNRLSNSAGRPRSPRRLHLPPAGGLIYEPGGHRHAEQHHDLGVLRLDQSPQPGQQLTLLPGTSRQIGHEPRSCSTPAAGSSISHVVSRLRLPAGTPPWPRTRADVCRWRCRRRQARPGIWDARGSHRQAPHNLPGAPGKGTSSKCSMIPGSGGSPCPRRSRRLSAAVTSSRYPTSMRVCRPEHRQLKHRLVGLLRREPQPNARTACIYAACHVPRCPHMPQTGSAADP
jgi:predicted Zn-dependent protease with MMP-like domain